MDFSSGPFEVAVNQDLNGQTPDAGFTYTVYAG